VWPSAALVAQLAALPRSPVPSVRWTVEEQWHVTLRFLGLVDDPAEAADALAALPAVGPVTATAGPAVESLSRSLLCVPVQGLDELAAAVVSATAAVGQPPEDRPFRGHITLARSKGKASVSRLAGPRVEATWSVEEITLVASETHPQGARYTVIGRYPL
jgi:RNA 2',3'-cyclic 3'-phosphodiesterase